MKIVKKYLVIIMAAVICLMLGACGGDSGAKTVAASSEAAAGEPASIWIVNHTGEEIGAVYVFSAGSGNRGEDRIDSPMADEDRCQIVLQDITEEMLKDGLTFMAADAEGKDMFETPAEASKVQDGSYVIFLPRGFEQPFDVKDEYKKDEYIEYLRANSEEDQEDVDNYINFPDDFSNAAVNCPSKLVQVTDINVKNSLNFNSAAAAEGGDEKYVNIMLCFLPVEGYDEYLTAGAAKAKPYLNHMLGTFEKTIRRNFLLKSVTSDFKDHGNCYSMNSFSWLDGKIFGEGVEQPVRGRMQVRYYGPTGYVLVASTVALDSLFQEYCGLTDELLDSCTYDPGWSTSPKARPEKPAPKKSNSSGGNTAAQSDSGDYGTPYYWYDEDGDVWYWNGYDNEFISLGSDGYIDDDGQFYESNDAGGDTENQYYYDDFDPWSDPGDTIEWEEYEFNDYDPHSDPGDYGTSYGWTDEDGDVWFFNGSEDEFIGSGDDYYVEDGQYYENNDAGWDDEEYYEPNDAGWEEEEYYEPNDAGWEEEEYYEANDADW